MSDDLSDDVLRMYAEKRTEFHIARMARELLAARKALAEREAERDALREHVRVLREAMEQVKECETVMCQGIAAEALRATEPGP